MGRNRRRRGGRTKVKGKVREWEIKLEERVFQIKNETIIGERKESEGENRGIKINSRSSVKYLKTSILSSISSENYAVTLWGRNPPGRRRGGRGEKRRTRAELRRNSRRSGRTGCP